MKLAKLLLSGCVFSLGVGLAASSYTVKIVDPTWIGQTELKPGDYKVQLEGDKAQLKMGKTVVEVPRRWKTVAASSRSRSWGPGLLTAKPSSRKSTWAEPIRRLFSAPVQRRLPVLSK